MVDLMNRSLVLLREGKPARLGADRSRGTQGFLANSACFPPSRCSMSAMSRKPPPTRAMSFPSRSRTARPRKAPVAVVVSAKIESEIAVMPAAEQKDYLDAVGLDEPGLNRVIRAGYDLLHLVTYFTVGPKEARAWTDREGHQGARAAAGVIHTDFEKGFIRAETIAYDDYVAHKGEAGAREAGKFRLEGKEYVVADGDVLHFRFAN